MTMQTNDTNNQADGWKDAAAASAEAETQAAERAMPPRRFEELLPCKLTDDELRERGASLEEALQAVDVLKVEKKTTSDEFKARIQLAESKVREIRDAIRTKVEDRSVECVESFEIRLGVARTTRVDTGEQIRERALRSSELQPSLPLTDERQMDLADAMPDDDESDAAEPLTDISNPETLLEGAAADEDGPASDAPPAKKTRSRKSS